MSKLMFTSAALWVFAACSPGPDTELPLSASEPTAETELLEPTTASTSTELDNNQTDMRNSLLGAIENYETADDESGFKGYYAQLLGMAGREDIPYRDGVTAAPSNTCDGLPDDPHMVLLDAIGDHTLIIINEDHTMPRDRAFILPLLKALRTQGFTHYAAETFDAEIPNATSSIATVDDGYYSNDPIYGRLVTYAKQAGYKLVAYEQTSEQRSPDNADIETQIATRETAQVDNLLAAVLTKAPDTKMIVHVGHSHVAERPIPNRSNDGSTAWMASRLKARTGINPLTISQTGCVAPGDTAVAATSRIDADGEPAVALTDYVVGHPPLTFTASRPDWRRNMGDIDTPVPAALLGNDETTLIEARPTGEADITVPIDRILLEPGESGIPLLLPPGQYRVEAFTKTGLIDEPVMLSVAAPE